MKSSPSPLISPVAILGCGDLGLRLARLLDVERYAITGIRRSIPASLLNQRPQNLLINQADICDPGQLLDAIPEEVKVVVVTMTPSERSDEGYRQAYVESLQNLLELWKHRQAPQLLLYVSSTRVYPQDQGQWVDEHSETGAGGYAVRRLLEAESLAASMPCQSVIVRFSGIYGPGRERTLRLVESQLREQGGLTAANSTAYSNRIHADDCARVLAHLIDSHRAGCTLDNLYLASDMEPTPTHEVHQWIGRQMQPEGVNTTQPTSDQVTGKRCRNQRLLDSGFRFSYPSYREGYQQVIEQRKAAHQS